MSSVQWPAELWVVVSVSRRGLGLVPVCRHGRDNEDQPRIPWGCSLFGKPYITHMKLRAHETLVSKVPFHGQGR